jgi:hypothetical protein
MLKAERKFGVKEVAIRMERHFMPNGRSGRIRVARFTPGAECANRELSQLRAFRLWTVIANTRWPIQQIPEKIQEWFLSTFAVHFLHMH